MFAIQLIRIELKAAGMHACRYAVLYNESKAANSQVAVSFGKFQHLSLKVLIKASIFTRICCYRLTNLFLFFCFPSCSSRETIAILQAKCSVPMRVCSLQCLSDSAGVLISSCVHSYPNTLPHNIIILFDNQPPTRSILNR